MFFINRQSKIENMKKFYFYTLVLICNLSFAQYGNVSTIAGGGTEGHDVIGGLAVDAELSLPTGIAIDNDGNIYFSEITNSIIRKISTDGVISDIVSFPDVHDPDGLAVDANGNLFFCDRNNHRIRKLDANGTITTVAGNGMEGDSGDGGQATSAQLNTPQGVAVDANGNIYISDWQNNKIKKVSTNGIITTIAGTGEYGFSGDGAIGSDAKLKSPAGIAVDAMGNVFFCDRNNYRVRKIDANGIITTIAGKGGFQPFSGDGGLAIDAEMWEPQGISIDGSGNIFIVDRNNHRIRKVITNGIINTIVGTGSTGFFGGGFNGDGLLGTDTELRSPSNVAVDNSGNVLITDYKNHRIRKLSVAALSVSNFVFNTVEVYPNPTANSDKITIKSQEEITTLSVYNSIGQQVYQARPNSSSYLLSIENLTSGIYFLTVGSKNNARITYKLIRN